MCQYFVAVKIYVCSIFAHYLRCSVALTISDNKSDMTMERKKWGKTRVKDASRIDNKGFVDINCDCRTNWTGNFGSKVLVPALWERFALPGDASGLDMASKLNQSLARTVKWFRMRFFDEAHIC
jgi:hypothetical protein